MLIMGSFHHSNDLHVHLLGLVSIGALGPVLFGRGGGGGSLTQTFYPVLASKSSGFARILVVFCPKMAT